MVIEGADHALDRGSDEALPGGLVLVDIELLDLGDDLLEELVATGLGARSGADNPQLFEPRLEVADPRLFFLQQLLHVRSRRYGGTLEQLLVELRLELHEPVEQFGPAPARGRLVAKTPEGVLDPAVIVVAGFGQGERGLLADGRIPRAQEIEELVPGGGEIVYIP